MNGDFIIQKEPILWSWAECPIPPYEPHTSHKRKENKTDIRLDLPKGLCCNVLHHWKKITSSNKDNRRTAYWNVTSKFPLLLLRAVWSAPQHIINCKMPLKRSTMKSDKEKKISKTSPHLGLSSAITGFLQLGDGKGTKVRIHGDLQITSRHACSFPLPARALATGARLCSSLCSTSLLS